MQILILSFKKSWATKPVLYRSMRAIKRLWIKWHFNHHVAHFIISVGIRAESAPVSRWKFLDCAGQWRHYDVSGFHYTTLAGLGGQSEKLIPVCKTFLRNTPGNKKLRSVSPNVESYVQCHKTKQPRHIILRIHKCAECECEVTSF